MKLKRGSELNPLNTEDNRPQQWKPTVAGNYINVSNDTDRVIIHYNTQKKKHQPIHFELQFDSGKSVLDTYNNRLSDLLRRSYKLYKRKYVFIPKNTWGSNRNKEGNEYKPVASSTPSAWMRRFVSGRYININSLRSAFISYWWNKMNSNEKDILVVRISLSLFLPLSLSRSLFFLSLSLFLSVMNV